MAKETPKQQAEVAAVMHEFKKGKLKGSGGQKIRNPRQAIAIALHEAGASRDQTGEKPPRENDRKTRAELYEEAKRRKVPNRSRMTRDELLRALEQGGRS